MECNVSTENTLQLRLFELETNVSNQCAAEKEALTETLNTQCASETENVIKELQDKHNKILLQNIDSLTDQQKVA